MRLLILIEFVLKPCLKLSYLDNFTNSQSGMRLSYNESIIRIYGHIDFAYHFVRDMVINNVVRLQYVPTSKLVADMLVKPYTEDNFVQLQYKIDIKPLLKPEISQSKRIAGKGAGYG